MSVKHTPGPWEVRYEQNVFAGRRLIANCGGHQSNVHPEQVYNENIANARLVAAAPDLLAVCQAIYEVAYEPGEDDCSFCGAERYPDGYDHDHGCLTVLLEQAITRATNKPAREGE